MSYIDADGLFSGDRMEMLSDEAKLYWPYFWCASNTVGRIELSYRKMLGRAFHHFKVPLSEERFWAIAREYRDCYLLFIYKRQGVVWGQWDTPKRFLPQYATAPDKRTPEPPVEEFINWRNLYLASKEAISSPNSLANELFTKVLKTCEKVSELSGQVATERRGSGSGSGSGEEETNTPQPPSGGLSVVPPERRKNKRPPKRPIAKIEVALGVTRMAWWRDWWSIYPCHSDKRSAMDAFEVVVVSLEIWGKVRAGALRYRQKVDANPELPLKYGQGWINGERWEDEGDAARARAGPALSKSDRTMEIFMENMAEKMAKEQPR